MPTIDVPNGIYTFTNGWSKSINVEEDGQVKGLILQDKVPDTVKWQLTKRPDGWYDIVSVSTGYPIRIVPPHDHETAYTLFANEGPGQVLPWDLSNSIDATNLMFKAIGTKTYAPNILDVSDRERVILWENNGQSNQYWGRDDATKPANWVQWVRTDYQNIPKNAVKGGNKEDGGPWYVGRAYAIDADGLQPGKVGTDLGLPDGCKIGYNGKEIDYLDNFEVLVADTPSTYKWVTYAGGTLNIQKLGAKPVEVGRDWQHGPLYSAQATLGSELIPGKAGPGYDGAYLVHDYKEIKYSGEYKVLCFA